MKKPIKKLTVIPIKSKTPPSHHVRLTPELQIWAEKKARTYRSVAAWIVDLVREAYTEEERQQHRKAA